MRGTKFTPEAKMLRVMQMVSFLLNGRWSVEEIASRMDFSVRTAYRYLILLESLEVLVDKDWDNKYFIASDNCPVCGGEHKSQASKRTSLIASKSTQPGFLN